MDLAPLRRGHRRVLVTARAAPALVLALFATLPAAPQAGDAAAEPVLRWRLDTTTPFAWQAVTAVLELVAPAPLPLAGPPRVEPVAGLDLQPLPAGDGIEALAGTDRFVIPVARYRLTARAAGRTTLPAARAAVGGTERTAGAVELAVRPVADPIAAARAVGEFERAVAFRWLGADAGELTVEVTGSGSVPFVEHPPPEVSGGSIVETAQEVDEAGTRKRWRYRLHAAGDGGALSVVVPALPYLRLPDGQPAQIAAQTVALPPPAAAEPAPAELPAAGAARCGAVPPLLRQRSCRAAELHDLGVSRFASGDTAAAVLALRAALRLRGWPETRSALAAIEAATELTGLRHGADTAWPRRGLWTAGLFAAAAGAAAALRRGTSGPTRTGFAAAGLAALLLAVGVAALAAPGGVAERRMAVIGRAGAAVHRVPAPEGSVVARLPAGQAVAVSRRFQDYTLIEDRGVGSGWVATATLAALQR